MTRLSVNLNKVALMRNARGGARPSLRSAAVACIEADAHGITLHPRPDGRHALAEDVYALQEWLPVELNVEGNPFAEAQESGLVAFPGFMEILRRAKPAQATLVPDSAGQLTSDHGWRFDEAAFERLKPLVAELKDQGSRVSLFMDPDLKEIERAHALGADRIELYTGPYADRFDDGDVDGILIRYQEAAKAARDLGLGVNAGHDLNLDNLGLFLQGVQGVEEVSIGQALISDALFVGLASAVRAYLSVIEAA